MRPKALLLILGGCLAAMAQSSSGSATANPNGWRRVGEETAVVNEPQAAPAAAPTRQANGEITIPAGAWITIRVDQLISSEYNRPGDVFGATLAQPLVADGYVVARRGQTISGRVTEAIRAGRVKGTSRLGIELLDISLSDGQIVPIRSQLVEFSAGTSKGNDTAVIGTTTGVGAAIGAAAGGGFGAGMGAIAGAGASAIGVLIGRGRSTEVPPESVMKFRLMEPVVINTARSQHAFQAVQQNDYESRPLERRVQVRQAGFNNLGWGGGWGPGWWGGPGLWGPGWGWGGGWGFGPTVVINRGWGGRGWGGGGWGRGGRWR